MQEGHPQLHGEVLDGFGQGSGWDASGPNSGGWAQAGMGPERSRLGKDQLVFLLLLLLLSALDRASQWQAVTTTSYNDNKQT